MPLQEEGRLEGLDENEFIPIKPQGNNALFGEALAQKIANHIINKGVLEN